MRVRSEYIRSLPLLFGRPVLAEFARTGHSAFFAHLISAAGLESSRSIAETYDVAFELLLREYRCEYVFKNLIAQRLLLERHPWDEARLLSEFRVGIRKADVVIVNGTSTVYEIKTGLDNLDRLREQLVAYQSVFDRIYVVCEATDADRIAAAAGDGIGVVTLTREGDLLEVRAAEPNAHDTIPACILGSLRKAEYLEIIRAENGHVPDLPNGLQWNACLEIARTLDPSSVHARMVEALRSRSADRGLCEIVANAPDSLKHATLTLPASAPERSRLVHALATPSTAALTSTRA